VAAGQSMTTTALAEIDGTSPSACVLSPNSNALHAEGDAAYESANAALDLGDRAHDTSNGAHAKGDRAHDGSYAAHDRSNGAYAEGDGALEPSPSIAGAP
jgi:hypothetical protein